MPFPTTTGAKHTCRGTVAQALSEKTGEFFEEPTIELIDVVVEKQPA
ncbi:hypothetical protein [Streptomyces microflavus]